MQNDKKLEENKDVCRKVLDQIGKPENYLMCRALNVFDDKYRVNIYTKRYVEGIEGNTIKHSYFCKYSSDSGNVKIVSGQ